MDRLTDDLLYEIYHRAILLRLDLEFIKLLEVELNMRGLIKDKKYY